MGESAAGIFATSLRKIVGQSTANVLGELGLFTAGDLLTYYPRRYVSANNLTDLSRLVVGEHVTVMARVLETTSRTTASRGQRLVSSRITDGASVLDITFFLRGRGHGDYHERRLKPGSVGLFTGTVSQYRDKWQLTHPNYVIFGLDVDDEERAIADATSPIPIYRGSAKLPTWRIEKAIKTLLDPLSEADFPEILPQSAVTEHGLISRFQAFQWVHQPRNDEQWAQAQRRLKMDEAVVLQTALGLRRLEYQSQQATARAPSSNLVDEVVAGLPFALTSGQQQVLSEISADLSGQVPMHRLLQGEVGSGKTVIALLAMTQVLAAGGQCALLAPTEILAHQHYRSIKKLLGDLGEDPVLASGDGQISVRLLTGGMRVAARRQVLADCISGAAQIVVGTHALLSDPVQFADLGLVVVDEQHRFGVRQRDALRGKGTSVPHTLVMTATPIPRTVAMTVFGDLDVSTLRELPVGRAPITTHVVGPAQASWRPRIWSRAAEEISAGGRVYVVCPRIEAGEDSPADLASVEQVAAQLRGEAALAGMGIGELHGRMSAEEKDQVMTSFASGQTPVLVSTTVVEVGVDVSAATMMVVLDAERFGLSQLHQLRGRIGRGTKPGLCLLVSDQAGEGTEALERLTALAQTTDGFELAEKDLELRAEGDVLGAMQSGRTSSLKLLRVTRDATIISTARQIATQVLAADPKLAAHEQLASAIAQFVDEEAEEYLDRS